MSGPTVPGAWEVTAATRVAAGDRVRVGGDGGTELIVSRVEPRFLGREGMVAFIEDTPERWLKVPVSTDAEVEVAR